MKVINVLKGILKKVFNRLWAILKTIKWKFWNQGFYGIGADVSLVDKKLQLTATTGKFSAAITFDLED